MARTIPFMGRIKKTGATSLGVTIPVTIRNKVKLGEIYEFKLILEVD